MIKNSHAVTLDKINADLPKQVLAWSAEANDRFYDAETIFDYIDGGAEVYRAYNLQRCLSRRYTSADKNRLCLPSEPLPPANPDP